MNKKQCDPFSIKQLEDKISRLDDADQGLVKRAFLYQKKAHSEQKRQSGKPYYTHPLAVAHIVCDISCDASLIAAALLHDVLEDTPVTDQQLKSDFGEDIYNLVYGVTKLGKMYFGSSQEAQVENYRRLFLATAKDIRVVIIKLADRYHNMQTLSFLSPVKQLRISKESMDIFVPLANRLGMGHIKWELEDLCFSYLNPEAYKNVKQMVATRRQIREKHIAELVEYTKELLKEAGLEPLVIGRPKHFYSIYQKMLRSNMSIESIYDMSGLRIITDSVKSCYETLGLVHAHFKPMANRIKDYISMPKANMYQSLHTTVIGLKGNPVEFQIRTKEMHGVAERGIAAHWKYKKQASDKNFKADFDWLNQLIDTDIGDPGAYLDTIKLDLFLEETYVFSPKGDLIVFPLGSTPLDFAYRVHSDIGNSCRGAMVNGQMVSLDYVLKNGDQVSILTAKTISPKLAWLELVKTREAKSKIKAWFRKHHAKENSEKGHGILVDTLKKMGLTEKEEKTEMLLEAFCKKHKLEQRSGLYVALSYGDLAPQSLIKFIQEETSGLATQKKPALKKRVSNQWGIDVAGVDNIQVQLAKCCHPFPGDSIVGFITLQKGVTIHREYCPNLAHKRRLYPKRIVEVNWQERVSSSIETNILVQAYHRNNMTNEVIAKILELKYQLLEATSKVHKSGHLEMRIRVLSQEKAPLGKLMQALRQLDDVFDVTRPH